jgi:DNA-binding MarR family transcriptional regulator
MPLVQVSDNFEQNYPDGSRSATACTVNLVQIGDRIQKAIGRLQRPYDLTPASGYALSILASAEGPLAPNEIARQMILTRATITGIADSLERRGYAVRAPHPTDRRMLLIQITDEGRRVAHEMRQTVHSAQREWVEPLNEDERETLLGLLDRLQRQLEESES